MSTEKDPIKENKEYNLAKKWLHENGELKLSETAKISDKGINSKPEQITYTINFQKKGGLKLKP